MVGSFGLIPYFMKRDRKKGHKESKKNFRDHVFIRSNSSNSDYLFL